MRRGLCVGLLAGLLCLGGVARAADGPPPPVRSLLRELAGSDYRKAWSAAGELGKQRQHAAAIAPALLEALQREWPQCSGDIREAIGVSLGQLLGREAVFPLLELIRSGKNIAHECAECGCCFLALTPADVAAERAHDPFCENALLGTIHRLADGTHSKAMADLVTAGRWRPELLITIGRVGLPRYAHFIARHKDDPEPGVRAAVARGLGLIDNGPVAVPVLVHLLGRGNEEFGVRWEAAEALIAIGARGQGTLVRDRLPALLRDPDPWTAVLAARVAARLGEPGGLERLRQLALDNRGVIRQEAVLALGEAADTGAQELLVGRLRDESLAVRAAAMYALGRTGDAAVIPALARGLEEGLRYQGELEARLRAGGDEGGLRRQQGYGVFDLRETHHQAREALRRGRPAP